jgi:hypothetical protein
VLVGPLPVEDPLDERGDGRLVESVRRGDDDEEDRGVEDDPGDRTELRPERPDDCNGPARSARGTHQ